MKSSRIAMLSLMTTMALVLSIMENLIPLPFIAPGAKIGLANIITMICIITLKDRETFFILITRIFLAAIFGAGLSGFIYSLTGGILSFLAMVMVRKTFKNHVSSIGISVTGAVFHNVGQVTVATVVLNNILIFSYLPILMIVGILSGAFVGACTNYFIKHLNRISFFKNTHI